MRSGNRSLINWLLSGVSVTTAYWGLSLATFFIGILSFFALDQVEKGIFIFIQSYDVTTFDIFIQSVFFLKYVILASFLCVSIFIYLFGRGVRHHIFNQGYALELQIESFLNGKWEAKRNMRRHDELKSVMNRLHELADFVENRKKS